MLRPPDCFVSKPYNKPGAAPCVVVWRADMPNLDCKAVLNVGNTSSTVSVRMVGPCARKVLLNAPHSFFLIQPLYSGLHFAPCSYGLKIV